ncbi:MAG: uroporphyrinogen-III synthase [Chloroflexota bacterium]|jgi:uroporphyrinogen-III synthase
MAETFRPLSDGPTDDASQLAGAGLADKKVVVTRAIHQAAELADLLRQASARPVLYPCLAIRPPEDTRSLDAALRAAAAGDYHRLVLTSANTVHILAGRLAALELSLQGLASAAVGPKTAEAAEALLGVNVTLVAKKHIAESLAEEMAPAADERLLLPQSALARPLLAERLMAAGARVTVIEAYDTGLGQAGEPVPALLADGEIDVITFTSSSTVTNFLERLEKEGGQREHLARVCLAAIGPVTAATMAEAALLVDVMPAEYTMAGLVNALEAYFAR